uniref:Uncharacterized protein n=1 Tax=Trichinella nativa TaxID=6335 RepID=A0A0V1KJL3_9BILA
MSYKFLPIFQVLQPTVCVSHLPRWPVFLPIFKILPSYMFLTIFQVLQSYMSLTIFEVLQCAFLLFEVFQFSRHIPGPRLCISHFPRSSVFLVIF